MKAALALLLVPALLAGCLAGEPRAAVVPMGQIDGAVVDPLLHPFANQTVTLVQLGRTDQTSALGGFTFRDVPLGFYTLITEAPGALPAMHVVDVQEGKITRVILQLMPIPVEAPYFELFAFQSTAEPPEPGAVCQACEWAVDLDSARPAEVTLQASWATGPIGNGYGYDLLDITVLDDRGFPLFKGTDMASPAAISILGSDIHPEATELRVHVTYGDKFLPRTGFEMNSVMTLYHGATKDEMLHVTS